MRIPPLSALFALVLTTGAAASDAPQCPRAESPPAPVCIAVPEGLAYADTPAEARQAAAALQQASENFSRYFGSAPEGVLILSATLDGLAARKFAAEHGLDYAQVWVPAGVQGQLTARAMRQAGVDPARIRRARAAVDAQAVTVLRHELGHAMYAAMFWPDASQSPPSPSTSPRYGTPGPDWLDEAVAIQMEPPEAQARHLWSFIDAAKNGPRAVPSLADYLQAEHPVRARALSLALSRGPKSRSGVQVAVSTGADMPAVDTFYGQSLLTALFLAEASGDPRILAPISRAIARGATFEQWLATDGARHDLPSSLPELQERWDAWLLNQVLRRERAGKD